MLKKKLSFLSLLFVINFVGCSSLPAHLEKEHSLKHFVIKFQYIETNSVSKETLIVWFAWEDSASVYRIDCLPLSKVHFKTSTNKSATIKFVVKERTYTLDNYNMDGRLMDGIAYAVISLPEREIAKQLYLLNLE